MSVMLYNTVYYATAVLYHYPYVYEIGQPYLHSAVVGYFQHFLITLFFTEIIQSQVTQKLPE